MKNFVLFVILTLAVFPTGTPTCIGADTDRALDEQVSKVLAECEKIKLGMTRADLLKVFKTEGGAFTAERQSFEYQGCSHIKVDVGFKIADPKNLLEQRSTDVIIKISKPYLADPIYD